MHVTFDPWTSRKVHEFECKAELVCCIGIISVLTASSAFMHLEVVGVKGHVHS